jgi:serine/threonine protein kinase
MRTGCHQPTTSQTNTSPCSPPLNATFRSLYTSNVSHTGRSIFFRRLLEAVAFLHLHGICHRNIKPDNILVRSYDPPEAMLTGFGCASHRIQIPYGCPGTISYLAPEQVEGQTHGPAVDYWSCGVVGLELVLGKVVGSRILPGHRLAQYQDCLRESESPLNVCALAMLQLDPYLRMTAAEALPYLLKAWRKRGRRGSCGIIALLYR